MSSTHGCFNQCAHSVGYCGINYVIMQLPCTGDAIHCNDCFLRIANLSMYDPHSKSGVYMSCRLLSINAGSITNKILYLRLSILIETYDCIRITETWLSECSSNNSLRKLLPLSLQKQSVGEKRMPTVSQG